MMDNWLQVPMSYLHLFRRFILRALWREKTRSAVAAAGIALGVAVMLAIRLANSSVTDTFRAAVDSVSGDASLRIRGVSGRFDEMLLSDLSQVATMGSWSPVIEAYAMLDKNRPRSETTDGDFSRGELLKVLGVDILLDTNIRNYEVLRTSQGKAQSARQVLALLKDPYSIILTEKFLRRNQLRVGETVGLVFGSERQEYRIRGVLLNQGPARTLDGNFALMDIAAAQLAADRLGFLDYVDLRLNEDLDVEDSLQFIKHQLPEGLVVEYPDAAASRADTMVAAFQFNLTALSAVALIVGLFLIYNTISITVAARRDEIGMLQAIGAGRRMVLALFLGEALMLAVVGVLVGIPLGRLFAALAVQGTAQTVETFYIAGVAESSAAQLQLTWPETLAAILLTIPLALLAAALPAWDAATVPPVEAVRSQHGIVSAARLRKFIVGSCFFLLIGWLMTQGNPVAGMPVLGFGAELMFMLSGAALTPVLLWLVCRIVAGLAVILRSWGRVELRLATANLQGALGRVSISIAALAVSLSMMIAISVMVGSFRDTVVYWLSSTLSADLAVKPVMQSSSVSEARLSRQAVERIRQDPAVKDTVWFTSRQIPWGERTVRLAVTEMSKTLKLGRVLFKSQDANVFEGDSWSRAVLVSESFSLRFKAPIGSQVLLPTPLGEQPFQVAGVYYDYASNQGTVMLDVATYRELFRSSDPDPTPQVISVFLNPGADAIEARDRIRTTTAETERIFCVTNAEIRQEAMRIFESTFTITYALQLIAIVVAGLGVASTLVTMIYQRKREIGLLTLVGASPRQTRRMILFEAVILGGVSQLLGIAIGVLLAYVLIFVINVQSFGWTIQFHLPLQFLCVSTVSVLLGSLLFGLFPAVRAASSNPLQTVRED